MHETAQKSRLRVNVNLLHPKELPPKLPERFLKWLLSYGRFIVIAVEIVVVAAFISRFKLDADLDELKRKINLDLPYIEGLSADEALIKQTDLRLSTISQTYSQTPDWDKIFGKITSLLPKSIIFTNLTIERTASPTNLNLRINAQTTSNTDLAIFLNNLRKDNFFRDINLATINFDQDQIIFTITGATKDIK